jgi:hypothetical protein
VAEHALHSTAHTQRTKQQTAWTTHCCAAQRDGFAVDRPNRGIPLAKSVRDWHANLAEQLVALEDFRAQTPDLQLEDRVHLLGRTSQVWITGSGSNGTIGIIAVGCLVQVERDDLVPPRARRPEDHVGPLQLVEQPHRHKVVRARQVLQHSALSSTAHGAQSSGPSVAQ